MILLIHGSVGIAAPLTDRNNNKVPVPVYRNSKIATKKIAYKPNIAKLQISLVKIWTLCTYHLNDFYF
jgi:hypothetical protein